MGGSLKWPTMIRPRWMFSHLTGRASLPAGHFLASSPLLPGGCRFQPERLDERLRERRPLVVVQMGAVRTREPEEDWDIFEVEVRGIHHGREPVPEQVTRKAFVVHLPHVPAGGVG